MRLQPHKQPNSKFPYKKLPGNRKTAHLTQRRLLQCKPRSSPMDLQNKQPPNPRALQQQPQHPCLGLVLQREQWTLCKSNLSTEPPRPICLYREHLPRAGEVQFRRAFDSLA